MYEGLSMRRLSRRYAPNQWFDSMPRLRMRRECRECFPRNRLQRKSLVRKPDINHGTARAVIYVGIANPW